MAATPSGPSEAFLEELKRYAVHLAQPVFFGDSPRHSYSAGLSSASGCFVLLGQKVVGVTCQHVLDAYRRRTKSGPTIFQFGPVRFDPELRVIGESLSLDPVTFDMTEYLDAAHNGIERAKCIEPTRWPPGEIDGEDVLALAGFPGIWRSQVDVDHLRFYSFSSGATGVEARGESHLVTRILIVRFWVLDWRRDLLRVHRFVSTRGRR
jgi:hypothetical protein